MAELLVRGAGRLPQVRDEALASQVAWVAHRRRKVAAHVALSNQIQGHLDLVFPGLGACFDGILTTKAGLVLVRDLADPDRMRRLGVEGLVRFVGPPRCAAAPPEGRTAPRGGSGRAATPGRPTVRRWRRCWPPMSRCSTRSTSRSTGPRPRSPRCSSSTPAGVLTSLPGVGTVRASSYGAAIGDPERFSDAAAAYRASGLVPAEYSSAGRSRGGQHISREGSVELRIGDHRARPRPRRPRPGLRRLPAAPAQQRQTTHGRRRRGRPPRPPTRIRHAPHPGALRPEPMGRRSGGRARHGEDRRPAHQNDVTRPPASTMTGAESSEQPLAARRARWRGPGPTSLTAMQPDTRGLRT